MAIEFEKEQKRQKYLIGVVVLILVVTGVILWRGYFSGEETPESTPTATTTQAKFSVESLPQINFNILKDKLLQELKDYPAIEGIEEEEIGRENPFLPYNK